MALAEQVREVLAGGYAFGMERNDVAPLSAVVRKYESLRGTPAEEELSRGVAACLDDEDASVRAQALMFFEKFPDAAGGEQLVKLDRARFAGIDNPWMSGNDLEWQWLRSIGGRILRRDPDALAIGYAAALEPGRAQPLIAALTQTDPDWVAAHAVEIARANPNAAASLLANLRGHDVGAIGEKIAPLGARDPEFRDFIELFIDDKKAKRRILAALDRR